MILQVHALVISLGLFWHIFADFVGITPIHSQISSDFAQHLEVPIRIISLSGRPRKIVAAHGNMDEAHVVGTQRPVDVDELRRQGYYQ